MHKPNGLDANFQIAVAAEIARARAKFPGHVKQYVALAEEAGELAKALLDRDYGKGSDQDVWDEAVQVAAMAQRIATEGDTAFEYKPPFASMGQAERPGERVQP